MATKVQDGCRCVRDSYNGLLKLCGSNKYVVAFLFGSPVYWTIGAIVSYTSTWNGVSSTYYRSMISNPAFTVLAILALAWLFAIFAVLRFWPNLVSISVFIYEAFGHFCLVSLAILAYVQGSGSAYVTTELMRMYFAFIAFPIFLLLLSAEILRTHRSKMFSHNVSQDRMIEIPSTTVNDEAPSSI